MPQMNGKPTVDVKEPQQIQQPETSWKWTLKQITVKALSYKDSITWK